MKVVLLEIVAEWCIDTTAEDIIFIGVNKDSCDMFANVLNPLIWFLFLNKSLNIFKRMLLSGIKIHFSIKNSSLKFVPNFLMQLGFEKISVYLFL